MTFDDQLPYTLVTAERPNVPQIDNTNWIEYSSSNKDQTLTSKQEFNIDILIFKYYCERATGVGII